MQNFWIVPNKTAALFNIATYKNAKFFNTEIFISATKLCFLLWQIYIRYKVLHLHTCISIENVLFLYVPYNMCQ